MTDGNGGGDGNGPSGKPIVRNRMLTAITGGRSSTASSSSSSSRYDEAEFLVGGRGVGKGEIETVTFKILDGYLAELDRWIRSGKFPYKTRSDGIRHALIRHLREFLPSLEGEVEGSLLHELAQIDEVVAEWEFQNRFIKHIDNIAEQVNMMKSLPGGKEEVARRLHKLKRQIDKVRESFHKQVYVKMFMDRFSGDLPQISLLSFSGDAAAATDDDDDASWLPAELQQLLSDEE